MLSSATVAAVLVFMTGIATAAMTSATSSSKDVSKLNAEITMLNSDANMPQGDKIISKQLTDSFRVSSDKVNTMLGRSLQYGDVAATFAFADKMPGGITDANVNQIVNMRSKGTGWDQIAKSLNVSIGDVAGKLSTLENDAHKNIKEALADSFSSGTAAGGAGGMGSGTGEGSGAGTGGTESGTGGMSGGSGGGGY